MAEVGKTGGGGAALAGVAEPFERWILDSMGSGILAIDRSGALVCLNEGARRILGLAQGPLGAALGRDCRDVLEEQPRIARLLLETLERASPLSRAELELEGAPGRAGRPIGFTLLPVRDASGAVRGAAMLFRDLAPLERGDEQQRLHERLAALGQMAAGLAHEIRNPLAGMEVIAGLLKRRLQGRDEELELVEELLGELRAVARTVAAGLDFVRPVAAERRPVALAQALEEALARALARVGFDGEIERHYELPEPQVPADEEALRTLFCDLIVNALQAMAPRAGAPGLQLALRVAVREPHGLHEATVRVTDTGEHVRPLPALSEREAVVEIADRGPGVPAELREKIFYPFFTTKERGSGLGLAAAQKWVTGFGGALEYEDRPGGGGLFRVRLPLAADAAEDAT